MTIKEAVDQDEHLQRQQTYINFDHSPTDPVVHMKNITYETSFFKKDYWTKCEKKWNFSDYFEYIYYLLYCMLLDWVVLLYVSLLEYIYYLFHYSDSITFLSLTLCHK